MEQVFVNLSLILIIAVGISVVMKLLRQPLIIGYILTGIFVGPYFLNLLSSSVTLGVFSQIGVALLLFTVGLHLNPKVIKEVGKVSLITGVGQVLFTFAIGFLISLSLNFSVVASIYIALALTFSSTIIMMKLVSDKGDLDSVYGKISIGFLIVQDLIAVFVLMAISSSSVGLGFSDLVVRTLLLGSLTVVGIFVISWKVLPIALKKIARSQEFLFLFSVSWCLALASLFIHLNFSLEIGALIAGVALSTTAYSNEISSKMRPLRDFFIVLFFIVIGSQMVIGDVAKNVVPIIIFSSLILLGNPFIVMVLMGALGYTKRTGFLAGLTVAQIGEFSIILASLGVVVGHLTTEILSLITVISLITIAGSTYLVTYSEWLYSKLSRYLGIFEKKNRKKEVILKKDYDAILFGYNRIGFGILKSLKKINKNYLVVDYNPDTISGLTKFEIPCLYGDVGDSELLEELPLEKIKIAVSTVPDFETNELLINSVRRVNSNAIIIVRAHKIEDALELYARGASYVLTPHFLGGEYVSRMLKNFKSDSKEYQREKAKHLGLLNDMVGQDKDHPDVDKN